MVYALIGEFLRGNGFSNENAWTAGGISTWRRGSTVGRALAGGLVSRAEYKVTIAKTMEGVALGVESAMSGWSGSALGVAREHSQRKDVLTKLQAYLASLSVAAPAQQLPKPSADDPATALVRLQDLRARDLITEEEYTVKRAEVIGRL